MKWKKRGFIFKPSGVFPWSVGWAQIPRPLLLEDRIRIFYATRFYDKCQIPISQTSFIDVDKSDLSKIIYVHESPVLELGDRGGFSGFGIHPTMLIKLKNEIYFFYQGWSRKERFPYETSIGLAKSVDNGLSFEKSGKEAIFFKEGDEYFVNGVFILENEDDYVMFYSAGVDWINSDDRFESVYVLRSARSSNLISWNRDFRSLVEFRFENECQNSATVVRLKNKYHMWFCYRNALNFRNKANGYRIGYASSLDLINWHRDDKCAGIDVSISGWDSEMVCYPYVFKLDGRLIMLYSGNYFGRDGFGYAELDLNELG